MASREILHFLWQNHRTPLALDEGIPHDTTGSMTFWDMFKGDVGRERGSSQKRLQ